HVRAEHLGGGGHVGMGQEMVGARDPTAGVGAHRRAPLVVPTSAVLGTGTSSGPTGGARPGRAAAARRGRSSRGRFRRRRTGIEPARPRCSVSPVLKTGAPTRTRTPPPPKLSPQDQQGYGSAGRRPPMPPTLSCGGDPPQPPRRRRHRLGP